MGAVAEARVPNDIAPVNAPNPIPFQTLPPVK
jgi:hypothetical protein